MKLYTVLVAFWAIPSFAFAIGIYHAGDTLTNLSSKGLVLRRTADIKGDSITTVPYGQTLIVQKDEQAKVAVSQEMFSGYSINGYWVKVKTENNQEGYVFDGFLSRYYAPGTKTVNPQDGQTYSEAELYLLGAVKKKGVQIKLPLSGTQTVHYRQIFKNSSQVEVITADGKTTQSMSLEKGISVEEGYFLGLAIWMKGLEIKQAIKKGKVTVESKDGKRRFTVENRGGFVVLVLE